MQLEGPAASLAISFKVTFCFGETDTGEAGVLAEELPS